MRLQKSARADPESVAPFLVWAKALKVRAHKALSCVCEAGCSPHRCAGNKFESTYDSDGGNKYAWEETRKGFVRRLKIDRCSGVMATATLSSIVS
jgi:hypothetical protein